MRRAKFYVCVVMACGAMAASTANAVTIPLDFTGPAQSLEFLAATVGELSIDGSAKLNGAPVSLTPNPQVFPVVGKSVAFTTTPMPYLGTPTITFVGGAPVALENFSADTQVATLLTYDPFTVEFDDAGVTKSFELNGWLDVLGFHWEQSGPAVFVPLDATGGTFTLTGLGTRRMAGGFTIDGDTYFEVAPTDWDGGFTLTGTYSLTGPKSAALLELDGVAVFNFGLGVVNGHYQYFGDELEVDANLNLSGDIDFQFDYHFESIVAVPEPTSALLGFAAAAALGLFARRKRSRG